MNGIDHLVYATQDLETGMQEIERLTGVSPTIGGQHPGRGTRNALIALGTDVYLEIIAPDPDQPSPAARRWLGVDAIATPRLTTWAAKGNGLREFRRRALEYAITLGDVKAAERRRVDGVVLSWELTEPEPMIADGVIPFFIDWGQSPHPSAAAAQGARLVDFRIEHPDVAFVERMLQALELDVPVSYALEPALVAMINGPRGPFVLR